MKRSSAVALTLISASVLAGCEEAVETHTYPTVDACVAAKVYSPEECERNYQEALTQNAAVAPKYQSLADCEAEFGAGQCTAGQQQAGSSSMGFFMPFMMGYLMSNALNSGPASVAAQPLYRGRNGGYFTAGGTRVADNLGTRTTVRPSTVTAPRPTTTTLSRGGFGGRGTAVS